ncbi:hypothetical protein ACFL6C_03995 [Myxococcota bacterium]
MSRPNASKTAESMYPDNHAPGSTGHTGRDRDLDSLVLQEADVLGDELDCKEQSEIGEALRGYAGVRMDHREVGLDIQDWSLAYFADYVVTCVATRRAFQHVSRRLHDFARVEGLDYVSATVKDLVTYSLLGERLDGTRSRDPYLSTRMLGGKSGAYIYSTLVELGVVKSYPAGSRAEEVMQRYQSGLSSHDLGRPTAR